MRILVGTLFTIENELTECLKSIKSQTYQHVDSFIIKGKPNRVAHSELYNRFMDQSDNYELFIKVDADMVIKDKYLFKKIVDFFKYNSNIKCLKLPVHDFFSNRLISGMHIYRNTVEWVTTPSTIFLDINNNSLKLSETIYLKSDKSLVPAAQHCPNPSPFQSFHYGVHKGLKIVQHDQIEFLVNMANYHWGIVKDIKTHFNYTNDRNLAFAILGAELALKRKLKSSDLDFNSSALTELFKKYEHDPTPKIKSSILRLTLINYGYLPNKLRRIFVCGYRYLDSLYKINKNI